MEELTKTWNSLTLSECEGSNFHINEDQAKTEFILAAKFLTKRALNIEAIAKTFKPIWRSKNGFKIKKESEHVVLFTFDDKCEMEKIMAAEPWSFDKRLMILQRYGKETNIGEMDFSKDTFWVQVHDLPVRFRTRMIAERLCEVIGTVNKGTGEEEIEGDNFMRVRVTLDISKPLCRGRVISLDSGKEIWVPFKYERLPSLCFWCGSLMHDDRDCVRWVESEGKLPPEAQQFGPRIKAAPFVSARRYMVKVPGLFASKNSSTSAEKLNTVKTPPVVVVRTGNTTPEIIRHANEENNMEEMTCQQSIEEVLGEIDKEIKQFDSRVSVAAGLMGNMNEENEEKEITKCDLQASGTAGSRGNTVKENEEKGKNKSALQAPGTAGFGGNTGKENEGDQPCINDSNVLSPFAHAAHLSASSRAPLADISNSSVNHMHVAGTWKRLHRSGVISEVDMVEAVGEKRSARSITTQAELPKKRRVSQVGRNKK